ncbi:hypothetical protein [Petropleomorpha daqingensis]|uniref:Uncharacterized protein n=1 Tax=Petropleomorpha daqingensis TaxID=2026353 RepID=A0A853CQY0_9ACTN|nr:hypothetical protein [Petropleomorpha daqingensis]NYJ08872.1 hypothetical protein [Petropleomorpha daqingensis]
MTASVTAPAIPTPRTPSEPARRPRRERPLSEYWDVAEARWVTGALEVSRRGGPAGG